MAKARTPSKPVFLGLAPETMIEVIRTKTGEEPAKKVMTFAEWRVMRKKRGYSYTAYALGFSQFF